MKMHPWLEEFQNMDEFGNISFDLFEPYEIQKFHKMVSDKVLTWSFKMKEGKKGWFTFYYGDVVMNFNISCTSYVRPEMTADELICNSVGITFKQFPDYEIDEKKYLNSF